MYINIYIYKTQKRSILLTVLQDMSANFASISKHLMVSKGQNIRK